MRDDDVEKIVENCTCKSGGGKPHRHTYLKPGAGMDVYWPWRQPRVVRKTSATEKEKECKDGNN